MTATIDTGVPQTQVPAKPAMGLMMRATREAGFAAVVMLGLSVPILALRTEQNMANELVLAPRWNWVFLACVAVFLARFVQIYFINKLTKTLLILGCLTLLGGLGRAVNAAFDGFAATVFSIGALLLLLGLLWER